MSSILEQLQMATADDVNIYRPYYAPDRHKVLAYALTLYQQGFLEGERCIESGQNVPFVATWYVSQLPSEITRCRLQFNGEADLSYEVTMSNHEFVDCLISVIKTFRDAGNTDFPKEFYAKLLSFDREH